MTWLLSHHWTMHSGWKLNLGRSCSHVENLIDIASVSDPCFFEGLLVDIEPLQPLNLKPSNPQRAPAAAGCWVEAAAHVWAAVAVP